jgi:Tyrosyl-tRNA synthetase
MSISDELMWRYWTLLTDLRSDQIEGLKTKVASGDNHPMQVKKDLARRIVEDFHAKQAAREAEENWTRQFQKHETPEGVELVTLACSDVKTSKGLDEAHTEEFLKLDRILFLSGLAESGSDAQRKIKQRAVKIDGDVCEHTSLKLKPPVELTIRVGRQIRRVKIEP